MILLRYIFNKVLIIKTIEFEKQIVEKGKEDTILDLEEDCFTEFLPEASEVEKMMN